MAASRAPSAGLRLPRPFLLAYAGGALAFSIVLLSMARIRGTDELALWLVAYGATLLGSLRWPHHAPLGAGFAAFALGFARTWRFGPTLDLGLALVCVALAVHLLDRCRPRGPADGGAAQEPSRTDVAGLVLLAVAGTAVVSLGFAIARIRGFAPAPGFGYHVYRYNLAGLPSDEALLRAVIGAASAFCWFGLYEFARKVRPARRQLALAVFTLLLANTAVLLQQHGDYRFLHPAGLPSIGRLNGLTSFCYALGDGVLALFLLLPAWGSPRGRGLALTAGNVALMLHAVAASGSRTPLVAIVLAPLLWLTLRVPAWFHAGQSRRALLALTALAVVPPLAAAIYWVTPADHVSSLGRLKNAIERQGVLGHLFATRLSSYPLVFAILREYPLAGVGVGLYQPEVDKQRALLTPGLQTDPYLLGSYVPNQFLNTGAELGIPAMLALAAVFLLSARSGLANAERRDFGIGVLVLAVALQFGPGFYNSEALVFFWLLIGLAGADPATGSSPSADWPSHRASLFLAFALALGLIGQLVHRPGLSIESQWRRLRWRLNIGMQPPEGEGRWTGAEATFGVDTDACALLLRWHAGDPRATGYRARVTFYVDGTVAESTLALPGRIRETRLALPSAKGFKRISVRVAPPFVPARFVGGDDERSLGVFLHSETPVLRPTGGCP